MSDLDFSQEEVERARRYHRPLYLAAVGRVLLAAALYALLAFGRVGELLREAVRGAGWAGAAAAWTGLVVAAGALLRLPVDVWQGLVHERRWGFSTESGAAWACDRLKGLAIVLVLGGGAWTATVAVAHALPRWWWPPVAAGAAVVSVLVSFVAPVVLEPLFNRFEPLADERLAADLRGLAVEAGVPLRDVLVADASRRTTKSNAYVSGLGATRRVVLWDTLLRAASEREVRLVVAHELGHRRERHAAKLTALLAVAVGAAVLVVRVALGTPTAPDLPLVLLLLLGLELAGLPFLSALSRRWERVADRWSLELTSDPEAFERAHVGLARANLSDLEPPRWAYLLLFTHPTPPERLALGRRAAAGLPADLVA